MTRSKLSYRLNLLAAIPLLICAISSCRQDSVFEESVAIAGQQWSWDTVPSFDVKIDDASKRYALHVSVRHNSNYIFSNLFLLLHEKGPGLRDTAYRHELALAELDGRWIGKAAGGLYDHTFLAKENFQFPDTGVYTFSVEQNMRVNPLVGVTDVGIHIFEQE